MITSRGVQRRFPANQIRSVGFGVEPRPLRDAREALQAGQYEEALRLLQQLDPASITHQLVRAEVEYYRAEATARLALMGGADATQAGKALLDFLTRYGKQTHHYFPALERTAELAAMLGSYPFAIQQYEQIHREAPWPPWKLRALVLKGEIEAEAGRFEDALKSLQRAGEMALADAEAQLWKDRAKVAMAVALAGLGKPQEGAKLVHEVIISRDSERDHELFGRAYNALGICHMKAGQPKDAVLAFLHTDLLFNRVAEVHAQALYYLGQLWQQLRQPDRAVRARSLLRDRYGSTVWARKS